jgi:hypothetical protein
MRSGFRMLVILCWMVGAQVGHAQEPAGDWVLNLGKRTLMLLELKPSEQKGLLFSGIFSRPRHFQSNGNGDSFSHIAGVVEIEPIVASGLRGDALAFTVQNPADAKDKDSYLLHVVDAGHAELRFDALATPVLHLTRVNGGAKVAPDWDVSRTYSPDDDLPSSAEMKRIFDEDQKAREPGLNIDWKHVGPTDAQRREETIKLLNEDKLHSGEDFTWAAFVFQHGDTPDSYLLAHTLAMIAVRKGYGDALWIGTATLDRYLQSIKQPQIYGTQFHTSKDQPTTQEPYNRALISDAFRRQLGVPVTAAQEEQRKKYDMERGLTK